MKGVHKNFDVKKVKEYVVNWIKEWFYQNGKDCTAVVGISGGLDSTVVAALCVEALGKERVLGVLMPCGVYEQQESLIMGKKLCEALKIDYCIRNIKEVVESHHKQEVKIVNVYTCQEVLVPFTEQSKINYPPRARMAELYGVAQCKGINGRVLNTCNLSEDYIGYSTIFGDGATGALAPLSDLTKTEVRLLARFLKNTFNIPEELVEAVPSDGLCGKTDEENFGFTYEVLDEYIRTGYCEDVDVKRKIDYLHEKNKFKMKYLDCCKVGFNKWV